MNPPTRINPLLLILAVWLGVMVTAAIVHRAAKPYKEQRP